MPTAGKHQDHHRDTHAAPGLETKIVVLLIIVAMIAVQLRSYLQPPAILVSIPLGVAGAILGQLVLGFSLSFISIFGIASRASWYCSWRQKHPGMIHS